MAEFSGSRTEMSNRILSYSNPSGLVSLELALVQKRHLERGHTKDPKFSFAFS